MRAERGNYRILTPDEAIELVRANGYLGLQPLCGGLAPDLAWPSLKLVVDENEVSARFHQHFGDAIERGVKLHQQLIKALIHLRRSIL